MENTKLFLERKGMIWKNQESAEFKKAISEVLTNEKNILTKGESNRKEWVFDKLVKNMEISFGDPLKLSKEFEFGTEINQLPKELFSMINIVIETYPVQIYTNQNDEKIMQAIQKDVYPSVFEKMVEGYQLKKIFEADTIRYQIYDKVTDECLKIQTSIHHKFRKLQKMFIRDLWEEIKKDIQFLKN